MVVVVPSFQVGEGGGWSSHPFMWLGLAITPLPQPYAISRYIDVPQRAQRVQTWAAADPPTVPPPLTTDSIDGIATGLAESRRASGPALPTYPLTPCEGRWLDRHCCLLITTVTTTTAAAAAAVTSSPRLPAIYSWQIEGLRICLRCGVSACE